MTTISEINWDCLANEKQEKTIVEIAEMPIAAPQILASYANPLDIEEATKLLPWEQIDLFKKQSTDFKVVTFNQCKTAMSMARQSRKLSKVVEEKRKEIVRPHIDFNKSIKKIADAFIDELKSIEASMIEQVETFNKTRMEKSEEIGVDLPTVNSVEDGLSYEQEYWEFEISNIKEVSAEFLKLDDKKIRQALRDGVRNISGLKIWKSVKKRYRIK